MPRCSPFAVFLTLSFLLLAGPAQAQETDTTGTDPSVMDSSAADTTADTAAPSTEADTTAPAVGGAPAEPAPNPRTGMSGPEAAKEQARVAATSWLSLTDAGRFGESWDAAASTLQESISRQEWIERGSQARSTLNALRSRTLTRTAYQDSASQIPDGHPVVALQYRTEFQGGRALEAVITTKQDTTWKVAGYRVVPAPDTARAADTTQSPSAAPGTQSGPEPDSTQNP